jgi:putative SOS response-associated peptidase YedK
MCGRYASFLPAEAIARIFGTLNPLPNLAPSWNVAPTNDCAVVRRHPETGARHLDLLKWGLLPYWTKEPTRAQRPINARSETAAKSGMFKDALARRRCLVPADAFYEWKVIEGGKQPYAIARTGIVGGPSNVSATAAWSSATNSSLPAVLPVGRPILSGCRGRCPSRRWPPC